MSDARLQREGPRLRVTMLRCSTVLLELGTLRILTDPWFGMRMRVLPVYRRPGMAAKDLGPLDAVLVSHLHPDHYDGAALAQMNPPPRRVLLPPGALKALGGHILHGPLRGPMRGHKIASWSELGPGETQNLPTDGLRICAVPGPHTGPPPDEVNFIVDFDGWGRVFFGGDARFDAKVLHDIAARFGPIDLALLPVGGTRIFGVRTVMNPTDAWRAADILEARHIIPIHEGGIWMSVPPLSLHPGRAKHLVDLATSAGQGARVIALREGEHHELPPR
jgi:L-ascorbate metabolism protein UlaG (beta-lactamase superfamily)